MASIYANRFLHPHSQTVIVFVFLDELFGNCQKFDEPKDYNTFELGKHSLKILEGEVLGLLDQGYTWESPYTQCILGGVLEAFREGGSFDRQYCNQNEESYSVTPEIINTLSKYIQQGKLPEVSEERAILSEGDREDPWRDKKDELIKIHKYFGKKDEEEKRGYQEDFGAKGSYQGEPQAQDKKVSFFYQDITV